MARKRLTTRIAEDMKSKPNTQVEAKGSGVDNDPYNMNDTGHEANDPKFDEYAKGDPSAWAEDVHTQNPAVDDSKRDETGHAPLIDRRTASEAVAAVKKLEAKAVKTIVAAQRVLPGAPDGVHEKVAAILMHLPEEGLNQVLQYQEDLAKAIGKAASESSEEVKSEAKEAMSDEDKKAFGERMKELRAKKKKEAAELAEEFKDAPAEIRKQAMAEMGYEEEEEEEGEEKEKKEEKKDDDKEACADKESGELPPALKEHIEKKKEEGEEKEKEEGEEKDATDAKAANGDEDKSEEKDKDESKDEKKEEEKDEKKEEESDSEEIKLSSDDTLLDQIFTNVSASDDKKGASKLSGMVKKEASESGVELSQLWGTSPDISAVFGS